MTVLNVGGTSTVAFLKKGAPPEALTTAQHTTLREERNAMAGKTVPHRLALQPPTVPPATAVAKT